MAKTSSKKVTETGLVPVASDAALEKLRQEYPVEATFNRILLPRLGLISQDVTEGKGKSMKVVAEAGTFFTEKSTDEVDEDGKKIWDHQDIGTELEGIVLFQRKQLRMYDEDTELFTSSPVYDSEDEILPLFCDKKEVDRGTPKDLKAKYEYTDKHGKKRSKLEDNRVLYVLYQAEGDDEATVYQVNLRGTSMFAFFAYSRKVTPNTVVTKFSSEAKEKGSIEWNQMTFDVVRQINKKEAEEVLAKIGEIKQGVAAEKGFYAAKGVTQGEDESDEDFEARKQSLKDFDSK